MVWTSLLPEGSKNLRKNKFWPVVFEISFLMGKPVHRGAYQEWDCKDDLNLFKSDESKVKKIKSSALNIIILWLTITIQLQGIINIENRLYTFCTVVSMSYPLWVTLYINDKLTATSRINDTWFNNGMVMYSVNHSLLLLGLILRKLIAQILRILQ